MIFDWAELIKRQRAFSEHTVKRVPCLYVRYGSQSSIAETITLSGDWYQCLVHYVHVLVKMDMILRILFILKKIS